MNECPSCGEAGAVPGRFCKHCGAAIEPLEAVGASKAAGGAAGKASAFWSRRSKLGKAGIIIAALFVIAMLVPTGDDKPAPTTTTTQQVAAVATTVKATTTTRATTTTT